MGWLVPSFIPVSMSCALPTPCSTQHSVVALHVRRTQLEKGRERLARGGEWGRRGSC